MSLRVNNVNYSCSPMYNQNNNNNVMGYLCSSRNVENFYASGLNDNASSANRGQVKSKDDGSFWKYMGSASITSSDQDGPNSKLVLRLNDGNGADNARGINKLISEFGVSDGLPFLFHFHINDMSFVMRSPPSLVRFNGNEITISSPRRTGIHDDDFKLLKVQQGAIQLRVGVFDVNNGSQRQNVESKWN